MASGEEDATPILDLDQDGHLGEAHQVLGEDLVAALAAALAEDFPEVEVHPAAAELAENFKE